MLGKINFQITATPHLAVYDPTVQFEFWFSEKRIADIRQVETTARYLGTALYWIAASINIKPGHDYYFLHPQCEHRWQIGIRGGCW
ncbi:hypothetical protein O5621_00170 [Escherichia coli]|nr:hypothetical protein [Escherichia coli]